MELGEFSRKGFLFKKSACAKVRWGKWLLSAFQILSLIFVMSGVWRRTGLAPALSTRGR